MSDDLLKYYWVREMTKGSEMGKYIPALMLLGKLRPRAFGSGFVYLLSGIFALAMGPLGVGIIILLAMAYN